METMQLRRRTVQAVSRACQLQQVNARRRVGWDERCYQSRRKRHDVDGNAIQSHDGFRLFSFLFFSAPESRNTNILGLVDDQRMTILPLSVRTSMRLPPPFTFCWK